MRLLTSRAWAASAVLTELGSSCCGGVMAEVDAKGEAGRGMAAACAARRDDWRDEICSWALESWEEREMICSALEEFSSASDDTWL